MMLQGSEAIIESWPPHLAMYDVNKTMRWGFCSVTAVSVGAGCFFWLHRSHAPPPVDGAFEQQDFVLLEQQADLVFAFASTNEGGVMPRASAQFSFSAIDMQPQLVQHWSALRQPQG